MPAFLSPLFLVGVAAAAIPIAIHLFYRRTEPVIDFAAMRYLRRAPVEHSRRRRLRELVLLALRVTALVLLALAFARPYFSDSVAAQSGAATLVMIDTSVSLSAPGRFEAARERARRAIEDAPATHAVGLVAFAQAADVIAPVSQDRAGAAGGTCAVDAGRRRHPVSRGPAGSRLTPSTDDRGASSSSPTCSRADGTRQATVASRKRSASKWRTSARPTRTWRSRRCGSRVRTPWRSSRTTRRGRRPTR